jgi:crotonobetainyl-CoA:carnitine CoA-transferase CaiB-like acyl-CoA transferase
MIGDLNYISLPYILTYRMLIDIEVIEVGNFVSAPYAASTLADS